MPWAPRAASWGFMSTSLEWLTPLLHVPEIPGLELGCHAGQWAQHRQGVHRAGFGSSFTSYVTHGKWLALSEPQLSQL